MLNNANALISPLFLGVCFDEMFYGMVEGRTEPIWGQFVVL
jgi:hypothetical protein